MGFALFGAIALSVPRKACGRTGPLPGAFGWPFLAKVSGLGLPKAPAVETTMKPPWFRCG